MNERSKIVARLILTHIFLQLALTIVAIVVSNFLVLSIAQTVLLITYFTGYWEFFGIRFRVLFCATLELILVATFVYGLRYGFMEMTNLYALALLSILQLYLLYELIKIVIVIIKREDVEMEIQFPFKTKGTYLITDGGNSKISRLMNYHYYSPTHKRNNTNLSMLFATDIQRLSKNLNWLPTRNEDYPIFDEKVYSPMEGTVFKIVSGIHDNTPFSGNYPYNTGNTVVIRNKDYYFLLGHLKFESFQVKEGERIERGQWIANIGNSGWTERPHLHMQLIESEGENYWHGKGISITYKNRNLYKNRIVRMDDPS